MRQMMAGLVIGLTVALPAGAAGDESCPPRPDERARVAKAIDGATLQLEDERTVRLISTLAPGAGPGETQPELARLAETARSTLHDLAAGREVGIAVSGRDRHGRLLAHVTVEGDPDRWLQRDMVDKGLARVYSLVDYRRCVRPLLAREAAARDTARGFWSTVHAEMGDAGRPAELVARAGLFTIVEGRVESVGERPKRTYLNFGTYWSQDFTVFVNRGDIAHFDRAGIDLGELEGRRLRVRGWILEDRGPAIHMTHPEQLEIVDGLGG